MNNKDHFYITSSITGQLPEDRILVLVDKLLDALYIPAEGEQTEFIDKLRLQQFHIDELEPVNWGALRCSDVSLIDEELWQVLIDEAMPDQCPTLCDYVERFMKSWGWDVRVKTEW